MPKPPFVSACGVTNHSVKDAAAKHGRSVSDVRLAIKTNVMPTVLAHGTIGAAVHAGAFAQAVAA